MDGLALQSVQTFSFEKIVLKILQVTYCFYPDPVGGVEVYVESLAKQLNKTGTTNIIAAPAKSEEEYEINGLKVKRYVVGKDIQDLGELYGEGDPVSAESFGRILDKEKPNVVHFHALTRGVSLLAIHEAKKRKIQVMFTYHTATVGCPRGTLLRWGQKQCDGQLRLHTCSRCMLHGIGIDFWVAFLIGSLPSFVGKIIRRAGFKGKVWTALRMTELMQSRVKNFRLFIKTVDHFIVMNEWAGQVLQENGCSSKKISLIPHGIPQGLAVNVAQKREDSLDARLRVAFFGRISREKGLHVILEALLLDPALNIQLDVYGVFQGGRESVYAKQILTMAQRDSRVLFCEPVPSGDVRATLSKYDLLAVPSQCLETGPLVVLEAFAAGIPVIGSNLGGVAEKVQDGIDGCLVKQFSSPDAWEKALKQFFQKPELLEQFRSQIRKPTTMEQVAQQTRLRYESILN